MLLPLVAIAGVFFWAGRLGKQPSASRLAVWVAYGLVAIGGLTIFVGLGSGLLVATSAIGGEAIEPSQKARRLAEGISEAMNCGALGLLFLGVAAAWIAFWKWRSRRP